MSTQKSHRRTNQRWTAAELDRLLRSVKLEDVTPPAERFFAIAGAIERTPQAVRGMWLELRDAALRGRRVASPAVGAYVRDRFPSWNEPAQDGESLDALIAAYRSAQRRADALLERVFALAAQDAESLGGLRQTLFGAVADRPAA